VSAKMAKPAVALINPKSAMLPADILRITDVAPTENPIVKWSRDVRYHVISVIDENNDQMEIYVQPSPLELIRPSGIRAEIIFSITTPGGLALDDAKVTKKISLPWNGIYGMFTNLQVWVNEYMIDDANNLQLQRSSVVLQTMKNKREFENELLLAGVFIGKMTEHDDVMTDTVETENSKRCQALIKGSKPITWSGPIHTPICDQDKVLPPNTSLRFKFTRASMKHILCLVADGDAADYKLKIHSFQLIVPKLRIPEEAAAAIAIRLNETPARYKMRRIMSTYLTIPPKISSYTNSGFLSGTAPLFSLLTLMDPALLNGAYRKSSTKYDDYGLRTIQLCLEDEWDLREPIRMTAEDNTQPVFQLLRGLGIYNNPASGRDCIINRDNFNKGHQIFFFTHTNDSIVNPDIYQELKGGGMKFEANLAAAKDEPIVVVSHHFYQSELKLYGDRKALFEDAS
jgi:hypothetical protein